MKILKFSKETGFTLIEILTVIIIIGVLAAIAIPVFSAQRSRAQDSQTVSDVRNIVTAAETFLADRTKSAGDILGTSTLDYASAKNVLWDIKGNNITGGYCIAAYNASGKDYNTNQKLLTYDSTAGGLKKTGGSCGVAAVAGSARTDVGFTSIVTPSPTSSTAVGSSVAVPAFATNLNISRASSAATTVALSWTAAVDTSVTGYKIERSNDGSAYTTVTTTSGRTNVSYNDTGAGNSSVYYKITPMISSTPSSSSLSGVAFTSPGGDNFAQYGTTRTFTVPDTGTYLISSWGAKGGNSFGYGLNGGSGAVVSAKYSFTAGQVINIVVGAQATDSYYSGGGGGGSFVYIAGASQPLQVAGGGGGADGGGGSGSGANSTAVGGSGNSGSSSGNAGAGAGWNGTNGQSRSGSAATGNWAGGDGYGCNGYSNPGGYGGGGGGGCWGGGGGGGYTGGSVNNGAGTSYVNASATESFFSYSTGTTSGRVFISELSN